MRQEAVVERRHEEEVQVVPEEEFVLEEEVPVVLAERRDGQGHARLRVGEVVKAPGVGGLQGDRLVPRPGGGRLLGGVDRGGGH